MRGKRKGFQVRKGGVAVSVSVLTGRLLCSDRRDTTAVTVTHTGDMMFSWGCIGTNISEVYVASIFRTAGK
jgi:hypothetical protein